MRDIPLAALISRLRARKAENEATDILRRRAAADELGSRLALPEGVAFESVRVGHLDAEWIWPGSERAGRTILYLHGGGFVSGSCSSHRALAAEISVATSAATLVVNYRLAPEHAFPSAHDDATMALDWVRTLGRDMRRVSVVGDSAGANLAVHCVAGAIARGEPRPGCLVLLSPWLDLTCAGDSFRRLAEMDPILRSDLLREFARHYCPDRVSLEISNALNVDVSGFPPTLIQVGSDELVLDDSSVLHQRLTAACAASTLHVWQDMFHVWHGFAPRLKQAREAIDEVGVFVASHAS